MTVSNLDIMSIGSSFSSVTLTASQADVMEDVNHKILPSVYTARKGDRVRSVVAVDRACQDNRELRIEEGRLSLVSWHVNFSRLDFLDLYR